VSKHAKLVHAARYRNDWRQLRRARDAAVDATFLIPVLREISKFFFAKKEDCNKQERGLLDRGE
jgi:hypothetical protein